MDEADLWKLERAFWLGGADVFAGLLDPACVMALPPPAGVMRCAEILDSLRHAPRWTSVEMTDRVLARPDEGLAVLAYLAEGRRGGDPPYRALCSSTYRLDGGSWLLVQHQQTPRTEG